MAGMMERRTFIGADGQKHEPSDPDYWQARTRELENAVGELRKAIVDLQYRLSQFDGGELHWPADSYERPYDVPRRTGRDS
jgi:hypothetical protein